MGELKQPTRISTDLISMKHEAEFLDSIREVINEYRDSNPAKLTYAQVIGVLYLVQNDLAHESES